ncbi:MAG: tetratricopeptide repeat-containing diguanylate cyclase [Trueperaceae bacterium]|nr:tetratricopeptide repeat-containing diguanylate cyclase [Trueperaceae bacterium]
MTYADATPASTHAGDPLLQAREDFDAHAYEAALERAAVVATSLDDPTQQREAHRLALQAAFYLGRLDEARRHGYEALRIATDELGSEARASAHNDLAVTFGVDGLHEYALEHLWQALQESERAGLPAEGGPLNNLGNVYLQLERYDEAVAMFDRATHRFEEVGDEANATLARANVGRAHGLANRPALAIPALDGALEAFERLDRLDHVAATWAKLGRAHGMAGADERAKQAFERAMALHEAGHGTHYARDTRFWYGVWALEHGTLDEALTHLEVLAGEDAANDAFERFDALEPLSRAYEAVGRTTDALTTLRRHVALDRRLRGRAADAAVRVRLLELELGLHGDHEVARMRSVELERANADLRLQARRLEELSVTDQLTGLANRRALDQRLRQEVANAQRHGRPFVLALLDLDRFKEVNDVHSHEVGDRVLARVAALLVGNLRASDVAARWGGEEFALLLPDASLADATHSLARVRRALSGAPWSDLAPGLNVSASVGAVASGEVDDPADLLRVADRRLYRAKSGGRDRTVAGD